MKARFTINTAKTIATGNAFTYDTSVSTCGISQTDGSILLKSAGTYLVLVNVSATASATDIAKVVLTANGTPVEGATATVTPIADSVFNIAFSGIVTVVGSLNEGYATLKVLNEGTEISVQNASVIIVEV